MKGTNWPDTLFAELCIAEFKIAWSTYCFCNIVVLELLYLFRFFLFLSLSLHFLTSLGLVGFFHYLGKLSAIEIVMH